jgi:hypothetical protein
MIRGRFCSLRSLCSLGDRYRVLQRSTHRKVEQVLRWRTWYHSSGCLLSEPGQHVIDQHSSYAMAHYVPFSGLFFMWNLPAWLNLRRRRPGGRWVAVLQHSFVLQHSLLLCSLTTRLRCWKIWAPSTTRSHAFGLYYNVIMWE